MSRRRTLLFFGLVLAQVLVLVGMAAGREATLQDEDNDVTLQTVPVDPRDLFRGDYVVLRYEISTIDMLEVSSDVHFYAGAGDTVFVELRKTARHGWSASNIGLDPERGWERYLRGTVTSERAGVIEVEYGIEQYFVPEGTGYEIENAGDVDVVVAVGSGGRGVIRHLIVDGEVWEP